MNYPCLKIDLGKISHNSKIIRARCAQLGISVVGVTKCVLGDVKIAEAIKKSGVNILGDSRLENLIRLRNFYGSEQQLMMLRSPMPSEIRDLVEICDISLNTDLKVVEIIAKICQEKGIKHRVVVMVETDDQREGLLAEDAVNFCRQVVDNYESIEIYGLGTNARCVTKNGPAPASLRMLIDLSQKIMEATGRNIPVISGGNSSIWNLIEEGLIPDGINQVRMGEAILMGHNTVDYKPVKGAFLDCFLLEAEIIEVKKKDSETYKVILALGLQDVSSKNIYCCSPGLYIMGQSSDHTILGIKEDRSGKSRDDYLKLEAGGMISFNLDYFGLLSCMTSPFVKKSYIEG
jgi:predicted amino acid racemase